MKLKIKQYVDHYFRFDKRPDLESLKEEIIGNLCDRYDEALLEGLSEQEAYLKAVKSMGDFQAATYDTTDEQPSVLPSLPEYLLPISAILAGFGFILIFLNGIVGGILTAISIAFYAVGGYYLYSKAMVVKTQDLDIELHKNYLKRIFKYMKTSFAFWSFNIAYLIALLVQMLSNLLVFILQSQMNPDLNQIRDTITLFITLSVLAFVVSFIVMIILSHQIYHRLKVKYYLLTGEKEIKGKIKDSYDYIKNLDVPKAKDLTLLLSYIFGLGSIGLFLLSYISYERYVNQVSSDFIEGRQLFMTFRLLSYEFAPAMLLIFGYLWIVVTYVLVLKYRKSKHLIFQSYIVFFLIFGIFDRMMDARNIIMGVKGFGSIFIFIPATLGILYYLIVGVQYMYQRLQKR